MSTLDRIAHARLLLIAPPARRYSARATLAAAGLSATGAVLMALAIIAGPGLLAG